MELEKGIVGWLNSKLTSQESRGDEKRDSP